MTIQDIEKIARLALELDIRPETLKEVENRQKQTINRSEPIFYYNFLFLLSRIMKPESILELGTLHGGASAHLAFGSENVVWTVDTDPNAGDFLKGLDGTSYHIVTEDSLQFFTGHVFPIPRFFLFFADTVHTYDHTMKEYQKYKLLMSSGSIMLWDDIHLSPEMEQFWSELPDPKVDISFLHESGFGACIVS